MHKKNISIKHISPRYLWDLGKLYPTLVKLDQLIRIVLFHILLTFIADYMPLLG